MLSSHSATFQAPSVSPGHTALQASASPAAGQQQSLLRRAGLAFWHAMEDFGQARANRQLRLMADRWELSDPELAAELRKATEFDCRSRSADTVAR